MPFDAHALLRDLFPPSPTPAGRPIGVSPANPVAERALPSKPINRLPGAIDCPRQSEWLALWRKAPQVVPPPQPCSWCRCSVFWKSVHGVYVCSNCHPPAYPALAEMWLQLIATDDGPQLVRLRVAP